MSIRRNLRKMAMAALVAAVVTPALSLNGKDLKLPTTRVNGQTMYYYDTQRDDNIYEVAEKLGVSRDELVKYNPAAADGLRPHMRLFIPVSGEEAAGLATAAPVAATAVKDVPQTHVVQKGETLYGISRKYKIPVETLIELNPSTNYGLKAGQRLKLAAGASVAPSQTAEKPAAEVTDPKPQTSPKKTNSTPTLPVVNGFERYEIQPEETLYTIAMRSGITLEELQRLNPQLDITHYKSGQWIYLPESAGDAGLVADTAEVPSSETPYEVEVEELYTDSIAPDEVAVAAETNVAVILPLMLRDEDISRQTQLYTEFYKGLLLAADRMRTQSGAPVKFHVYDTANDLDTVRGIMGRDEISDMDLIIAPDNQAQFQEIVSSVLDDTYVMNIFGVRDETYRTRRNVVQTNIPHKAMYANAIEAFMERYPDQLPVFLSHQGGSADKESFTSALKERLDSAGRVYREVSYTQSLSDSDIEGLDPDIQSVVFIPNSGSKNEFAKFVKTVTRLHDGAMNSDNVQLWGYPEWITFRGESFDEICNLGAVIYSRYFQDENDPAQKALKERYEEVFGSEMFDAVPTQGLLGYDMGVYVIEALRGLDETDELLADYSGVQSALKLVRQPGGGYVNDALFIIGFRPGGVIQKLNDR